MAEEYKTTTIRMTSSQAAGFEVTAAFRGESFNSALISAMRLLVLDTFGEEIKAGKDLLLRKLPEPLHLSDVCEAFGIDFEEK